LSLSLILASSMTSNAVESCNSVILRVEVRLVQDCPQLLHIIRNVRVSICCPCKFETFPALNTYNKYPPEGVQFFDRLP